MNKYYFSILKIKEMKKIDINEILRKHSKNLQMSYYVKENIIYVDKKTTSISGRFQFLKKI